MPGNTTPRKLLSRKTFLHTHCNNGGNFGTNTFIRSTVLTGRSRWTGTGIMFKKPHNMVPKKSLKRKLSDNRPSSRVEWEATHVNSNSTSIESPSSSTTDEDEEVITETVCLPLSQYQKLYLLSFLFTLTTHDSIPLHYAPPPNPGPDRVTDNYYIQEETAGMALVLVPLVLSLPIVSILVNSN